MARKHDILLRIALAFSFIYPAVDALIAPESWIGYFPQSMRGMVPDPVLLGAWGLLEVLIALWILSGKRIFIPALLAGVLLLLVVLFNVSQFEVVFRDVSLALLAFYLAYGARPSFVHSPPTAV